MADHTYKLSEIPKKQLLGHFWEYYKIPAIITVVVGVIVCWLIYSVFLAPSPDTSIIFVSSNAVTSDSLEKLEEELYEAAYDYNDDKKNLIDFNTNIIDSSTEIDLEKDTAAKGKLIGMLAMDSHIIQIVDEPMFNFLKEEELIGTYADFRGYETGAPVNSDVKIPLSELEFFKESPELLNNDFYLTIRDRESSHIEGSKKKTQNYENHLDMFARIAGFKKIG